jgi:hypothetical protein
MKHLLGFEIKRLHKGDSFQVKKYLNGEISTPTPDEVILYKYLKRFKRLFDITLWILALSVILNALLFIQAKFWKELSDKQIIRSNQVLIQLSKIIK